MGYWLWASFSLEGRIGRGAWWGVSFAWAVFFLCALSMANHFVVPLDSARHFAIFLVSGLTGRFKVLLAILLLIIAYVNFALNVKRFHDRGMTGLWTLPAYGLPILAVAIAKRATVAAVFSGWLLDICVFFWVIVGLGIMPGDDGANFFGEDPIDENVA